MGAGVSAAAEGEAEESAQACPICLDVAPRQTITVCGHHFCSDCIHECAAHSPFLPMTVCLGPLYSQAPCYCQPVPVIFGMLLHYLDCPCDAGVNARAMPQAVADGLPPLSPGAAAVDCLPAISSPVDAVQGDPGPGGMPHLPSAAEAGRPV